LTNLIFIYYYRFDPKNFTLNVAIVVQKPIILEGQYETNGRVIILPINGNGTCRFTLGNLKLLNILVYNCLWLLTILQEI